MEKNLMPLEELSFVSLSYISATGYVHDFLRIFKKNHSRDPFDL
jgi:hypothetical protein